MMASVAHSGLAELVVLVVALDQGEVGAAEGCLLQLFVNLRLRHRWCGRALGPSRTGNV
jgi:hypothetical protein